MSMRFIANENFPQASVVQLRQSGYEVCAIVEQFPGAKDSEVLQKAAQSHSIILTFDRDYGELIYRLKKTLPGGLVFFRFIPLSPTQPSEIILRLINNQGIVLENRFTVISSDNVRQRPLR